MYIRFFYTKLEAEKTLNSEKVIKMSILHDWAESKIGDFMPEEIGFEKKSELDHKSSLFDSHSLNKLLDDLKKSQFNISDTESKISEIAKQIDSSKNSIYDIISKLELNLRQASSIAYKLSYNENDFQN